jgi:hypothetical protein
MTGEVDLPGASIRQSHGSTSASVPPKTVLAPAAILVFGAITVEMNSNRLLPIWPDYQHIIAVYALAMSK